MNSEEVVRSGVLHNFGCKARTKRQIRWKLRRYISSAISWKKIENTKRDKNSRWQTQACLSPFISWLDTGTDQSLLLLHTVQRVAVYKFINWQTQVCMTMCWHRHRPQSSAFTQPLFKRAYVCIYEDILHLPIIYLPSKDLSYFWAHSFLQQNFWMQRMSSWLRIWNPYII